MEQIKITKLKEDVLQNIEIVQGTLEDIESSLKTIDDYELLITLNLILKNTWLNVDEHLC